jgi:hypothetical protein
MKLAFTCSVLMAAGITSAYGQFGIRFGDESFTAKGYQAVYSFESGQLLMLTDTAPARQEGYIFVDPTTGSVLSSFLLDSNHGAQLSPDATELLMAGSDGSLRTVARYQPTTLELIDRAGISLGDNLANTAGIGGNFEPTPDGRFLFNGTDLPGSVNFMMMHDREFNQEWATSFQYEGQFSITGVEAYPLAGGDIGFYVFFNSIDSQTAQVKIVDVFGLLDGESGELTWTFTYQPPLGTIGNRIEDFRFTFGSDGSFFAHAKAIIDISNITAPVDMSAAKVLRLNPDGSLAYSKSVRISDAVVVGEDYMDGPVLLHYSFDDEDSTQFVVLDSAGNVTGTTAVNNHLSAGDGDLTATRRSGTDIAFIRATYSPGGPTLARLDLTDGSMEFRQLPQEFPGNPVYEAVGSVSAYPVAPFNTPSGFASVSSVLAAEVVNNLASDFQIDLVELPEDGGFPECISYSPASMTEGTPLSIDVVDVEIIDLETGWTASPYGGLPGFGDSDVEPELLAMEVMVEVLCEDDGGGADSVELTLVQTGSDTAELSFQSKAGVNYTLQQVNVIDGSTPFSDQQVIAGNGDVVTVEISLGTDPEFFRVVIP